jgi:hypothetical protein
MGEGLTRNGHVQAFHVREVRRTQPTRFVCLAKEDFLGRTVLGLPLPHAPFYRPPLPLPILARVLPLQPLHQGLGL